MPTKIEILLDTASSLVDEESPYYYKRVILAPYIRSATRFDHVRYTHLGFSAWSHGKQAIRHANGLYTYIGDLEPNVDAHIIIPPFKLCLENLGDSFMGVHVRLPDGMSHCKMTILQECKASRVVDDFIQFEGIYYCTAVMNCLQIIHIEEPQTGDYDTQPLAEKGDSN